MTNIDNGKGYTESLVKAFHCKKDEPEQAKPILKSKYGSGEHDSRLRGKPGARTTATGNFESYTDGLVQSFHCRKDEPSG